MSAKHRSPEYHRNARTIKARVRAAWAAGRPVTCWRCRTELAPGTAYDVGHLPGATGSSLLELAPEHRHQAGSCPGNRRAGGRVGAELMHGRRAANVTPPVNVTRYPI